MGSHGTPSRPGYYDDVPSYGGPVYSSSPSYYFPATDRERAITRLSMLCGDPLGVPISEEEVEAREYFKLVMQTDEDLRTTTEYVKGILKDPNGEARLWREIVLPDILQYMRYQGGKYHYDKFNSPWFTFPERFVAWNRPSFGTWAEFDNHMRNHEYYGNMYWNIGVGVLMFYSLCWLRRKCYFWSPTALVTAKYCRLSRRYYGQAFDKIPPTPVYLRNEITKQAITRKMVREGRSWGPHARLTTWMSKGQATPKPLEPYFEKYPTGLGDGNYMK